MGVEQGQVLNQEMDSLAIDNFRKYLKIKTVHPHPDYDGCVKFLIGMAESIGMTHKIIEVNF